MRKIVLVAFVMAFSLLLVACGNSEAVNTNGEVNEGINERTIRLGHAGPETHLTHYVAEKLKEVIEAESDGKMKVIIYPNAQLGEEQDMVQQLKGESLDLLIPEVTTLSEYSSSFNAWILPFLTNDIEAINELRQSKESMAIFDTLDSHSGMVGLGYWMMGPRQIFMVDKPIISVNDLASKKIRVSPSPINLDFWKAMGVSPTSTELSELYSALQTGLVDGVDVDAESVIALDLNEVGDYLTLTNHVPLMGAIVYSYPLWNKLSEAERDVIRTAADEAGRFSYEETAKNTPKFIEQVKELGVQVNELEITDEIRENAKNIHEKYSADDEIVKKFIEKAKSFNES